MEATGVLHNITKNWQTDRFIISFEINEKLSQETVEKLQNRKLRINAKQYKQKRSLDANAYLWVLCTKIAEEVDSSKDEIYEEMLQKYGVLYQDEDGEYITITLKTSIDIAKVNGHWKAYKNNGKFTAYLMIKGTSEYDTGEMAKFLDKVVLEAKELGIETLPPAELKRLKEMWGVE